MDAELDKTPARRKKLQYRLGLVFLGLCLFWIITVLTRQRLLPVGTRAPEWSLVQVSEHRDKLSLGDLRGKVVVLDFWSTGCPPCVREIGELRAIAQRFDSNDIAVVGVSAWGESMADLREFKKRRDINYPLLLGNTETVNAYMAASLPTLYIIDKKGVVAATHQGFWPRESIAEVIDSLLKKP